MSIEESYARVTNEVATQEELLEQAAEVLATKAAGGGSVDVQAIIDEVLAQVQENDKQKYPVGYLWISADSTSPADVLGFGTWERIQDQFLLAAGSTYTAGSTGGEATHTLTIDEMPSHNHESRGWAAVKDGSGEYKTLGAQGSSRDYGTDPAGGDQPHNNMPPYLAVYVWQRTA